MIVEVDYMVARPLGTYAAGKIVGAVCHGPIGLVECVKADGTPLVAGLEVTCFSDVEEELILSNGP